MLGYKVNWVKYVTINNGIKKVHNHYFTTPQLAKEFYIRTIKHYKGESKNQDYDSQLDDNLTI